MQQASSDYIKNENPMKHNVSPKTGRHLICDVPKEFLSLNMKEIFHVECFDKLRYMYKLLLLTIVANFSMLF